MSKGMYIRKPNSALEIFTLAAVSRGGLQTQYALLQTSGLRPGGLQPVLKRLENLGLLERTEGESRRRRLLSLTDRGERFLEDAWRECLVSSRDMETILRAVTVALFMDHIPEARQYLLGAIEWRDQAGHDQGAKLSSSRSPALGFYETWRDVNEDRRKLVEKETLQQMLRSLEGGESETSSK